MFKRRVRPAHLLVAAIAMAFACPAAAQDAGSITGTVTDSSGVPIDRAEVSLEGTEFRAFTDATGKFLLGSVAPGARYLNVRRLGFVPGKAEVEVSNVAAANVSIRMNPVAAILPAIVVHPTKTKYTGRLAGYYSRLEKRASGYFITREDIDRNNPTTLTQVLQTVPGVRLGRGRAGITGMRMRDRNCWPLVWLDGVPMPAAEMDMDAIVPSSVQGIELYLGATTAPMKYIYNRDLSSCGTVLIWSRGPDTDPVGVPAPAVDLEDLLARMAVYSPDKVDRQARLDEAVSVKPQFPPALFAARVRGLVIAQFVVDTLGKVEEPTIDIVSSTAPLFSDAVRAALSAAVYVPALKDGHPVRQVVQQPFRFDVGG